MAYIIQTDPNLKKELASIINDRDFSQMQTVLIISTIVRRLRDEYVSCKKIADPIELSAAHLAYMWPGKISSKQLDVFQQNYDKVLDVSFFKMPSYGHTSVCLLLAEDLLRKKHPVTGIHYILDPVRNKIHDLIKDLNDLHFWFDRGNVSSCVFVKAIGYAKAWVNAVDRIQGIQLYTDNHPEDKWRACVKEMRELIHAGVPMNY